LLRRVFLLGSFPFNRNETISLSSSSAFADSRRICECIHRPDAARPVTPTADVILVVVVVVVVIVVVVVVIVVD
jgi:hypothetical protein